MTFGIKFPYTLKLCHFLNWMTDSNLIRMRLSICDKKIRVVVIKSIKQSSKIE